jgi:isopentenyldiphosphate isomerase
MTDNRKLNIVDEGGNIIGEETRENIHSQGLLHQEIHVWFYTSKSEIIFQHREENKDTFPDLLDATVGGHVEIGSDYEDTALQEIEEETGVKIERYSLTFIKTIQNKAFDSATNKINNVLRAIYAYRYEGKVGDLRIEKGKAIGFESWLFEKIFNISNEDKKRFIPTIFEEQNLEIFRKIKELI